MEKTAKSGSLGLIGTILGLFAISIAISHFIFGPIQMQQANSHLILETTINHSNAINIPNNTSSEVQAKTIINMDTILVYMVIGIGLISIVLGVISFIKHEDWRPGALALILGGSAMAFQFTVAMLLMILGVVIIIGFFISLGLT